MATREEAIAALRQKGYKGPVPGEAGYKPITQQTTQPQGGGQQVVQPQAESQVDALLSQLIGKRKPQKNFGHTIADSISILGGGKPILLQEEEDPANDLAKLYAQESIKKKFEDPTVRQLREAEIAALSQPPPRGFVRQGKQLLPDPDYIDPKEQLQIDKFNLEQEEAAKTQESKENLTKMRAQDIYNTVGEIEKGAGFFGMLGDAPSWAAPSSWLPGGKTYGERANWEANLDKLRAGLTLENINSLRNAGSTGSTGMGVLSDRDITLLTNAATALRRNLEPKDAMKYIKDIKDVQAKLLGIHMDGQGSNQVGGNQQVAPTGGMFSNVSDDELMRIAQGQA